MARRGSRVGSDRRFLALELIDSADTGARQPLLNFEDLRVVGRDYHGVVDREWLLYTITINPGRTARQYPCTRSLIAAVSLDTATYTLALLTGLPAKTIMG
jgi:hypothetical protein